MPLLQVGFVRTSRLTRRLRLHQDTESRSCLHVSLEASPLSYGGYFPTNPQSVSFTEVLSRQGIIRVYSHPLLQLPALFIREAPPMWDQKFGGNPDCMQKDLLSLTNLCQTLLFHQIKIHICCNCSSSLSREIEGKFIWINVSTMVFFPLHTQRKNGALLASFTGLAFEKLWQEALVCIYLVKKMYQDLLVPVVKARVCSTGQQFSS